VSLPGPGVSEGIPSGTQLPPAKPTSGRKIAWARRARAYKASWKVFRRSPAGIWGLGILVLFILIALLGPIFVPYEQTLKTQATGPRLAAPSLEFPMGTDNSGRSVLALWVWGARVSLTVGLAATVMTMLIGSVVGIAGAFFGKFLDTLLNAITNWFLVIPWIALAVAMASVLGPSLFNIILVISITSWAVAARLIRSQTLSVRNRNYVERARALGASNWHIITRHILPNVFPIIFAQTILMVSLAILSETTLSLIGLGDPSKPSWGGVLEAALNEGATTLGAWWWIWFPGLGITFTVLAFAMIGFALDEIINPKLRER
jgi:peptide/nickel transport system permease protein